MTADRHPPVLRLRGLQVGYDGVAVVRGVDLSVGAGEVVAVLGANGSGKTTLVRGLLGLAEVQSGEVELFGVPGSRPGERHRIGYVPQRHSVAGAMPSTVREVVATGRLSRRRWYSRRTAKDRAAVESALDTVALLDRSDEEVGALSGGQQRRVLIARALAAEPDVLVMDEPTAGVDASSQAALAHTLHRLADRSVTLVVVTHEVGPLAGAVTRAVVMARGRVAYDGPLTAAMASGDGHAELGDGHHCVDGSTTDVDRARDSGRVAGPVDSGPVDRYAPSREDRRA